MTERGAGRRVEGLLALAVALLLEIAAPGALWAQADATGSLVGRVRDQVTERPLVGAEVRAWPAGRAGSRESAAASGTLRRTVTDGRGRFALDGLPVGSWVVEVSTVGYEPREVTDVAVRASRPTSVVVELAPAAFRVEGITVRPDAFRVPEAAPTSVTVLGAEELRRTPGGFSDVSRSLRTLAGVSGSVDNRNDLVVRGGSPSENAYVLDGIRIPQINHFATQGQTGGALGLVNVDFIRETEFYTGGFPVEYGDALSSVLVIENRAGSPDGVKGDLTLGAAEAGLTLDGPAGPRASWLLSVRRSYLQYLFRALDVPIRPSYWDAQARVEIEPTDRDRILLVGIGAIDDFDLVAPEAGSDDPDAFEKGEIAERVLDNDQRTWTAGASWRRLVGSGLVRATVSRSWTDYRFSDDDRDGEPLLVNRSVEAETRLRLEARTPVGRSWTVSGGTGVVLGGIETELFQRVTPGSTLETELDVDAEVDVTRGWGYGQVAWRGLGGRARAAVGVRVDRVDVLEDGLDVSPRVSASFEVAPGVSLNAAGGRFVQTPSYLSLSVEEDGRPVNLGLRSPRNLQAVGGVAWEPVPEVQVEVEGFWKAYDRVPVLRDDSRVSLFNLGGDYGFVGAEPLTDRGEGRARGLEVSARRKLTGSFYGLAAYTLAWSEFSGADGVLRPSAWDRRHQFDVVAAWRRGETWEVGAKLSTSSGLAFTPFDPALSTASYAVSGRGVPDRDRIGAERTPAYLRLDVRLDRRFTFDGWNGVVYLDLQNVTGRENVFGYRYTEDPSLPDGRRPIDGVGFLPTFGFSVEF